MILNVGKFEIWCQLIKQLISNLATQLFTFREIQQQPLIYLLQKHIFYRNKVSVEVEVWSWSIKLNFEVYDWSWILNVKVVSEKMKFRFQVRSYFIYFEFRVFKFDVKSRSCSWCLMFEVDILIVMFENVVAAICCRFIISWMYKHQSRFRMEQAALSLLINIHNVNHAGNILTFKKILS